MTAHKVSCFEPNLGIILFVEINPNRRQVHVRKNSTRRRKAKKLSQNWLMLICTLYTAWLTCVIFLKFYKSINQSTGAIWWWFTWTRGLPCRRPARPGHGACASPSLRGSCQSGPASRRASPSRSRWRRASFRPRRCRRACSRPRSQPAGWRQPLQTGGTIIILIFQLKVGLQIRLLPNPEYFDRIQFWPYSTIHK